MTDPAPTPASRDAASDAPASASAPAPPPTSARASADLPPPPPQRALPSWMVAAIAIAIVVAGGAAAWTWLLQDRVERLERDLARRVQAVELKEQQREEQVRLTQDLLRDAQAKAAVLEAKIAESAGQQAQLRLLYDEMARSRGDRMLVDVEASVIVASQQLQLGGNVQAALLALQDAEQTLARSNQPAAIGLRRAIARDIERLKELPIADFAAAVSRLDAVIAALDQMPLVAEVAPAPPPRPLAQVQESPDGGGMWALPQRLTRTGQLGWEAFLAELRQLVRVQRIDSPDALLLAPDQRYFMRENLRLILLNSRTHLLTRNEQLLRADLGRAIQSIERYFDPSHRVVIGALANLRQLQSAAIAVELPSLSESLGAVRGARAAAENPGRR
jgi:uroporphyrin-III C-methyltransferase